MKNRYGLLYPAFLFIIQICGCVHNDLTLHSTAYEHASFKLADPDLEISLIASEPDIISPVDMCWGPDGSLYVVEMTGYPVIENQGAIKLLTDVDGDGYYELKSVYAENLNFPAGIMYYNGGILVADAPDILYLKDSDNDGKADVREVFITGFNEGNQQYRANSLHWGLDNHIYGASGRGGGNIRFENNSSTVSIDSRDFRIDPLTAIIESVSGMSQFGLTHDNWGNRFISYNHRFARQVILEEEHLLRNPSLTADAVFDTSQSEHDRKVWTLLSGLKRFNQDPIGYFTSLSGLTAYRGNLLGPKYEGSLFAGESVQAAVIHRNMVREGIVFKAMNMEENTEFLASNDDWFHPVNFSNGPDGALYVVDFYRKLVEHPEWAHDDKQEGVDWNEGQNHGRIWRIAKKTSPMDAGRLKPDMENKSLELLVAQFEESSGWRRDMAQQILVNGQMTSAISYLEAILNSENPLARLHGYWTLDGLNLLTQTHIENALSDEIEEVVIQGIKLWNKNKSIGQPLLPLISKLALDESAAVRFHAILSLGDQNNVLVKQVLIKSAKKYKDRWTRIALLGSVFNWSEDFAIELLKEENSAETCKSSDVKFFQELGLMMAHMAENGTNSIPAEIGLDDSTYCAKWALLAGYMKRIKELGKPLPELPALWYQNALKNIENATDVLLVENSILLMQYSENRNHQAKILRLVTTSEDKHIQRMGIESLSHLEDEEIIGQLYSSISGFNPEMRKVLISSAQNSITASQWLLKIIESNRVDTMEVPEELRYALLNHSDEELKKKSEELLSNSVDTDREAVIQHYLSQIREHTPNTSAGADIFKTNCTVCHAVKGKGGILGPDLTTIGNRTDEMLLISILDPSRMVSYELKLEVITTKSGKVYSGTIAAETDASVTIKQPNGEENTILKTNIVDRTITNQSIMPEGYERIIDEKSMVDLLSFLRNPSDF